MTLLLFVMVFATAVFALVMRNDLVGLCF